MTETIVGAMSAIGVVMSVYLVSKSLSVRHRREVQKRIHTSRSVELVVPKSIAHMDLLIVLAVGLSAYLVNGAGFCLLTMVAAIAVIRIVRIQRERIARRRYERLLPQVIDALIMSVRSGTGLPIALGEAANSFKGDIGHDLKEVGRRIEVGYGLSEAIDVWTQRNNSKLVQITVACLKLAHESGASVVNTLMSVRQTIGFALDRVEAANTAASQARASVYVLAGLPFFVSGPMLLLNASARQFMFHSLIGIFMSITGVMLDLLGIAWMNKLVQKAQA